MGKEIIKDKTGIYVELPRDKIKFVSKEAETMFDLSMENDYIQQENKKLKKKYENAVADYEKTMFEKEQLNSLVNSCQEEIRQLKKKQEKFRKYLENKLPKIDSLLDCLDMGQYVKTSDGRRVYVPPRPDSSVMPKEVEELLMEINFKYKEIIGDDK